MLEAFNSGVDVLVVDGAVLEEDASPNLPTDIDMEDVGQVHEVNAILKTKSTDMPFVIKFTLSIGYRWMWLLLTPKRRLM